MTKNKRLNKLPLYILSTSLIMSSVFIATSCGDANNTNGETDNIKELLNQEISRIDQLNNENLILRQSAFTQDDINKINENNFFQYLSEWNLVIATNDEEYSYEIIDFNKSNNIFSFKIKITSKQNPSLSLNSKEFEIPYENISVSLNDEISRFNSMKLSLIRNSFTNEEIDSINENNFNEYIKNWNDITTNEKFMYQIFNFDKSNNLFKFKIKITYKTNSNISNETKEFQIKYTIQIDENQLLVDEIHRIDNLTLTLIRSSFTQNDLDQINLNNFSDYISNWDEVSLNKNKYNYEITNFYIANNSFNFRIYVILKNDKNINDQTELFSLSYEIIPDPNELLLSETNRINDAITLSLIKNYFTNDEINKINQNNFNNYLANWNLILANSNDFNYEIINFDKSNNAFNFNIKISIKGNSSYASQSKTINLPYVINNDTSKIFDYTPHLSAQLPEIHINFDTPLDQLKDVLPDWTDKIEYHGWNTFPYHNATVSVNDPNGEYESSTNLTAQVKVRGNTTAFYYKRPFKIKFDKKTSMLGLNNNNKFKDWVLLASWCDPSMLRDSLGLYLGQMLYKNVGLYVSDFRYVDLYINNEYWGMYLLCEQNEVNNNRVNIPKTELNSPDVNIAYLLEMDAYAPNENPNEVFWLNYNNEAPLSPFDDPSQNLFQGLGVYEYVIKSKIYSTSQRDFIGKYLENIYRICYKAIKEKECYEFTEDKRSIVKSTTLTNPYDAVSKVVDIDSYVAVLILQEIICDYDVSNSSFYLSIDLSPTGDGKLHFQAPWDFDHSFGIHYSFWQGELNDTIDPKKLYAVNQSNPWLTLLYNSEEL